VAVEKASEAGEVMLKSGKVIHQGVLDTVWLRQSACLVETGKLYWADSVAYLGILTLSTKSIIIQTAKG